MIYYPKVMVAGVERIPPTGSVLFCGNHPNSLIDPIVIGIACRRPVRFMAKAPLFKIPVIGPIMHALGMIPAYRGSDDSKQVRRNVESLDRCVQILVDGQAVGIFPEGKSHDAMQVEMVRSGAARIAAQAVEQGADKLIIVPLGLNYDRKEQFRSSILVEVGQPIEVQSWLREQGEQDRKAIRALTNELEKRMKSVAIHLEEPGWEPRLEDLEALIQGDVTLKSVLLRKQIANAMNYFLAVDRPRAVTMAAKMQRHRDTVQIRGLTMKSAVLRETGRRLCFTLFGRIIGLVIGLLPAFLGLAFHLIPFTLTRLISSRVQPPGRTAVSFYRLLFGLPIYAVWYVLVGLLAVWMNGPLWIVILALLLAPVAGVIALGYWPHAWQSATQSWHQLRLLLRREECRQLRQEQDAIRSQLIAMADEYTRRDTGQTSGE
jgi:1-acyl-sn-glycerol-3-phosphate acyltransferase